MCAQKLLREKGCSEEICESGNTCGCYLSPLHTSSTLCTSAASSTGSTLTYSTLDIDALRNETSIAFSVQTSDSAVSSATASISKGLKVADRAQSRKRKSIAELHNLTGKKLYLRHTREESLCKVKGFHCKCGNNCADKISRDTIRECREEFYKKLETQRQQHIVDKLVQDLIIDYGNRRPRFRNIIDGHQVLMFLKSYIHLVAKFDVNTHLKMTICVAGVWTFFSGVLENKQVYIC